MNSKSYYLLMCLCFVLGTAFFVSCGSDDDEDLTTQPSVSTGTDDAGNQGGSAGETKKTIAVTLSSDERNVFVGGGLTFSFMSLDDNYVTVHGWTEDKKNVVIPYYVTYNGKAYTVSGIREYTFGGKYDWENGSEITIKEPAKSMISIEIPQSVTWIGDYAFYDCESLASVVIPNSVTSIGRRAFRECENLASVTLPNSITSIESYTFRDCKSLTSVTIPNSVTSIGYAAFYDSGLTSVTIPNSVTEIEDAAFYCPNLKTFKGRFASEDNRCLIVYQKLVSYALGAGLTSYTIPNNVKSIGEWAFWLPDDCCLTSIVIPSSVDYIDECAFSDSRGGVKTLTSQKTTPPGVHKLAFVNGWSNCTLRVPKNSVDLYKSATVWKSFSNIVGY